MYLIKRAGEFDPLEYMINDVLNDEAVVALWIDDTGFVWIGYLRSGLVRYDPATREYIHFRSDPAKSNSLGNNFVQCIYQDMAGSLWVATRRGLCKYDPVSKGFKSYTKADGLPSNVIVGILEDNDGNLWLSTTNGLSRFNPIEETFTNYNISDGLQGNQFWIGSGFKSESGELFFGGNNGFNAFYPNNLEKLANPYIPPIVITNVSVQNEPYSIRVYANTVENDTLNLSYKENQVSFEFAALDFTSPEKNQFAYMLEGFDNDWIYTGTRRYANYTNLDPGQYTFRVKGSNNDGVWNDDGISLNIYISTPFWKTGWAYILYVLLSAGLIYGVNAYIIGLVRVKHDLKIERMEKEKVQEINQFKLQFFTDVAHEFKTPLTLIQAPLEDILSGIKKGMPFEDEYRLMNRNVKYLLRLVHQLLNFRRAEQGRMELQVSKGDIVQFAREIFELFRETARKRSIEYSFRSDSNVIEGWFDWEKLEEILVNLIDNAFKYTPDNGVISVELDNPPTGLNGNHQVVISVRDSGAGINSDEIEHIFERFYHARDGRKYNQASSGLGLALTRRLVELHYGRISVQSNDSAGSCFTVALPLGKEHFTRDEFVKHITEMSHFHSTLSLAEEELSVLSDKMDVVNENNHNPLVLIVEDNKELRTYMKKTLARKFRIIEAADGRQGLEMAKNHLPNIIISDIIMPKMDGIELCREIKSDILTSHIPVILLTAKTDMEYKIEGIEKGADDYIEKPFHFRFLDARIKNLLNSREQLREQYRREFIMEPKEQKVVSTDEKFLKKLMDIIEEHLDDPDLEVKHLSSLVGMSRTLLFRKLQELTGYTPKELIKIIRLRKACQLLSQSDLTVNEIAQEVGFKYPKYFSTCFHQQYGIPPSQYRILNIQNVK